METSTSSVGSVPGLTDRATRADRTLPLGCCSSPNRAEPAIGVYNPGMNILLLTLLLGQPILFTPAPSEPGREAPPSQVILRYVPPEADARVTYTFTEESALDVDHLRSTMGDDVFERVKPDRSVKQVARRAWVDTTFAGEAGRTVRRTYAELGVSMEVTNSRQGTPRPDGNAAGTSALEGRTVEFVGPDASARLVDEERADGSETDDRSTADPMPAPDLTALTADASLQGFLPTDGEAVAVEEEWTVAAAAMRAVFAPGGDIETYYGDIEDQIDPDVTARFGGHAVSRFGWEVEGDVEAKLVGTESRDGTRLARIQIRFDVTLQRDPAPWMRAQSAPFEMAKIGQTARDASHLMKVVGEGTLHWDLDHHRFAGLQASAKTASDQKLDYAFDYRGHHFSGEEHFELSGTTKLELSAEYGEGR